jgi:large subunit ribosomal protein L29
MKGSEIREMTPEERTARLEDLIEEYRGLRFGHVMQQVSNPLELRAVRRDIARLKTIMAENEAEQVVEKETQATGEDQGGEQAEPVEGEQA